jgi:DNA-3-methyladenine glycosylase II
MMKRQDFEFRAHLVDVDREFLAVIQNHPPLSLPIPRPPFEALVRIVAGQQLSVKAADSVFQKLVLQLKGEVTVNSMLKSDWRSIQACGLSGAKLNCIQELVEFAGANEVDLNRWLAKDWNDLRERLLEVKGIGPWSVDMFGMFGLGL